MVFVVRTSAKTPKSHSSVDEQASYNKTTCEKQKKTGRCDLSDFFPLEELLGSVRPVGQEVAQASSFHMRFAASNKV